MNFEKYLVNEIRGESCKLRNRFHTYHNLLDREIKRKNNRTINNIKKEIKFPDYWKDCPLFNPFYVYKRADSIAHSICKKIKNFTYSPHSPHANSVTKKGGGTRKTSVYEIPDATISKIFFKFLIKKNRHRFSSYSYAYRNDRNAHYAVCDIFQSFKESNRLFIAEYDFSSFFDNIPHDFIISELKRNNFYITKTELFIIKSFLKGYSEDGIGIPQGLAISLFLANVTCCNLDKKFEDEGLHFARYADDTIIWTNKYDKICSASEIIYNFSKDTNIPINENKSEGISLLVSENCRTPEISKSKHSIDFLGYTISNNNISIKNESICKIKKHISYLIYQNLLQPINQGTNKNTPKDFLKDRDSVICLQQIRRYIYGDLSEKMINSYLFGGVTKINFKGVMSYYPIVTDVEQMKKLDGWMLSSFF